MSLRFTFLGTGTSAGIPMIGCDCDVCRSNDPRDRRSRVSALIEWADAEGAPRSVLLDTSPDLRLQALRHKMMRVDAVLYTHNHADHVFGLDDLRRFNAVMEAPIDIHAEPRVVQWLHQTFNYVFEPAKNVNKGSFVAQLVPHELHPGEPVTIAGRRFQPFRLLHGHLPILGFRVGDIAYCTDCSSIPPETWPHLEGLDVLVIDALRYRHHPTHMTIDQALEVIEQVSPRRAFLTHVSHDVLHADLEPRLPEGVSIAYDGLQLVSEA